MLCPWGIAGEAWGCGTSWCEGRGEEIYLSWKAPGRAARTALAVPKSVDMRGAEDEGTCGAQRETHVSFPYALLESHSSPFTSVVFCGYLGTLDKKK